MKVFKLRDNAEVPAFATEGSACFDLKACLQADTKMKTYSPHNKEIQVGTRISSDGRVSAVLHPQFRTLIPTGLIFDIPKNHVLKVYARSGMSVKNAIGLANSVGIIDSDYIEEVFIPVYNMSDTPINIFHGDRIAQAMLEKTVTYTIQAVSKRPEQKTERTGGLGSTGTN
jgi:dUTP pyrophosphatase